jgi:hypothetical protein
MSVKFEKETIKTVTDAATKGKDDLLHEVGQALTKGGGPNGYLAVSLAQLHIPRLRMKCQTNDLCDRRT